MFLAFAPQSMWALTYSSLLLVLGFFVSSFPIRVANSLSRNGGLVLARPEQLPVSLPETIESVLVILVVVLVYEWKAYASIVLVVGLFIPQQLRQWTRLQIHNAEQRPCWLNVRRSARIRQSNAGGVRVGWVDWGADRCAEVRG